MRTARSSARPRVMVVKTSWRKDAYSTAQNLSKCDYLLALSDRKILLLLKRLSPQDSSVSNFQTLKYDCHVEQNSPHFFTLPRVTSPLEFRLTTLTWQNPNSTSQRGCQPGSTWKTRYHPSPVSLALRLLVDIPKQKPAF